MRLNKTLEIVVLLFQFCVGQTNEISIKNLNPATEDYIFPEVYSTPDTKIGEKINLFLQLQYLQHVPGVYKKSPFETITYNDQKLNGSFTFYGWTKEETPINILSISMSCEYSGAYLEGYESHHNFDARNGNTILLSDIIHPNQQVNLTQLINQKIKTKISSFLSETRKNLQITDSTKQRELFDRYQEQINLYEDCLTYYSEYRLDDFNFYFTQNQLHVLRGRCSSHVNRAIDDLYEFDIPLDYSDLKENLSDYGKSLLYNTLINGAKSTSPIGKIFKGTIGKNAVTMVIPQINYDDSLTVTYWYDKYKIPIECRGTLKNNHFYLMEQSTDDFSGLIGIIEADWNNGTIKGVWINSKNKKEYPLVLMTY
jgi:hypothetical protein